MRTLHKYLIIIAVLFNACFAKEPIKLQLDWLHQFQFAGYYIAKEKGYYKEKNLDVHINQFDFNTNLLDHVLKNDGAYAVGKSSLIIDKIAGLDLIALAAIYQHSPMVLIMRKDSNIVQPKDLYKKRVMLTPDARMAVAINSMISSQGVKLSDVNFQPHSFKLDDLINKKTDAMGSYLSNEPFILAQKGIAFNIFDPRDYGFDFYGGLLFTSKEELNNHPQRVRDFYDATLRGWQYAFSNIEETAKLIFDKYNTQKKSLDSLIYEGEVLSNLAEFKEGRLGHISHKKYGEILKIYSLLGYEHDEQILREFIYNPNSIILTQKEKAYLQYNTVVYNTSSIAPFDNGKQQGIEFEYLNLIKELLPIKLQVVHNIEDKYDVQLNINNSEDREHITNAINHYNFAITSKSNINYIQSLHNLDGKKVAIIKDSFFDTNFKKEYSNIHFIEVENINKALSLLSKNEVYALISSLPIILETIAQKEYKGIKISGITQIKHPINFEVKNEILQSIMNKVIRNISPKQIKTIDDVYLAPKKQEKKKSNGLVYKIIIPLVIILLIILFFNRKLRKEARKRIQLENDVKEISNTDELTNINNRKMSIAMLKNSIEISKRYERPLCVILFDIDDFTQINQSYSYETGDQVLKELSQLVSSNIRTTDILGRWQGEEFILILPETTLEQAQTTAEHLKDLVYNQDFEHLKTFITCSFSVIEYTKNEEVDSLVKRASKTLLEIKENKKNSVKVG